VHVVSSHSPRLRRALAWALAVALIAALVVVVVVAPARGDLPSQIAAGRDQASRLQAAIAQQSAAIAATDDGLARAQARLSALQARVAARRAQLQRIHRDLVVARDRLTRLENRYRKASAALADNLRAAYTGDQPELATVVLSSSSFSDLVERMEFLRRVSEQNARILGDTKRSKTQVLAQTSRLGDLQESSQALAAAAVRDRNAASAVQAAILDRRAKLLRGRDGKQAELDHVQGQLSALKARQARAARAAARAAVRVTQQAQSTSAPTGGGGGSSAGAVTPNTSIATDETGTAQASAGAPEAVRMVIAAGNAIAGLPYLYGGGHGSFQASAYDCSGSVSYALAAAGLVASPLDSTSFESWGDAGPGKWITVYANAAHAFMIVDGWRFDTSALSSGGTRWSHSSRGTAGFVARHPPGL
jgi:peptidoglycan hydrolase CwlO-like protein